MNPHRWARTRRTALARRAAELLVIAHAHDAAHGAETWYSLRLQLTAGMLEFGAACLGWHPDHPDPHPDHEPKEPA